MKRYRPEFGLWWLLWMALGMLFFFALAFLGSYLALFNQVRGWIILRSSMLGMLRSVVHDGTFKESGYL
jgi:hypothetical protein